jgi:hypothetical protein
MSKIVLLLLCLFVICYCKNNKSSPATVTVSTKPVATENTKKSPIQVEPGTIKKAFRVFC